MSHYQSQPGQRINVLLEEIKTSHFITRKSQNGKVVLQRGK